MADQQPNPDADLDQVNDVQALRREAANRRRQLREVERERDALRERVDKVEGAQVERLAAEHLANPADLLLAVKLDDLRGDDGLLSNEKAVKAIETLVRERPHWAKPTEPAEPPPDPGAVPVVSNGARSAAAPESKPSFGAALKSGGFFQ